MHTKEDYLRRLQHLQDQAGELKSQLVADAERLRLERLDVEMVNLSIGFAASDLKDAEGMIARWAQVGT